MRGCTPSMASQCAVTCVSIGGRGSGARICQGGRVSAAIAGFERCHVSTRLFLKVDLAVLHEEQLRVSLRARVLDRFAAALPPKHGLRVWRWRDPGRRKTASARGRWVQLGRHVKKRRVSVPAALGRGARGATLGWGLLRSVLRAGRTSTLRSRSAALMSSVVSTERLPWRMNLRPSCGESSARRGDTSALARAGASNHPLDARNSAARVHSSMVRVLGALTACVSAAGPAAGVPARFGAAGTQRPPPAPPPRPPPGRARPATRRRRGCWRR
jgi:hypothetical protein